MQCCTTAITASTTTFTTSPLQHYIMILPQHCLSLSCCSSGAFLLQYGRQSLSTTLTNHVLEYCLYSATTTLVHHCFTTVPNYSYSATTDALQFDGMNIISEYDSSGLCLLQYYSATTEPHIMI
eukprot:6479927-Pyramimonas_sp.AAC.1